jgi:hypothetical protein
MGKIQNFVLATSLVAGLVAAPTTQAQASINKPSAPIIVSIKSSRAKNGFFNVTVKISVPKENGGSKITGSKITADGKSCLIVNLKTSCTIKGIANGKTFKVKARSKNKKGFGTASPSVEYTAGHSAYTILRPTATPTPTPTTAPTPTPTATPTPTPTATPTPTPTTAPIIIPKIFDELYGNSQGIAIAAWSSANEKIKKSDAVAVRQDIFVGPNTTIPNANVKEIFANATKLFAGFAQPQSFYAIYYRFQDKDWAKAKFGELNLSHLAGQVEGSCASLQRCNGASAGKASSTVGFSQYGVTEPGVKTDIYHQGGGLEIHEYTHIAQAMQFIGKQKDDQNINYLPRWFIEGHAHIAGNTGSAKTIEEYLRNRGQWLSDSPNQEIKSFEPVDIERFYAALMPRKYNAEMFGYVYTIGYITMECLVALKGIDSPTELIVQVSNGLTFEEAFAKVYGISWNDASPILAKTISQIFLRRK